MTGKRAATLLVTVLLAVSATGGCSRNTAKGKQQSQQRQAEQQAAVADIKAKIEAEPNVQSVEVIYQDNFTAPGSIQAVVHVGVGTYPDMEAVLDLVEREVWRSRLRPLASMTLAASDPPGPGGRTASPWFQGMPPD